MLPGMELMGCQDLAVPASVMQHVVRVESSFNPYAIGVVGGHLVRQPRSLPEALATVSMLERRGFNFSLGIAQVNRYNLEKYGLASYEQAFQTCPNLQAGSRILAECHQRSGGSWGKAFSCYYSGNFVTGYRHGYVQKVYASMRGSDGAAHGDEAGAIRVVTRSARKPVAVSRYPLRASEGPVPSRTQPVTERAAGALATAAGDAPSAPIELPKSPVPAASNAQQVPSVKDAGYEMVRLTPNGPVPAGASPSTTEPIAKPVATGDQAFVF